MDLSKALLEAIKLLWDDDEWIQNLDYEQVPFRCHRCHEYGHLFRECPMNHPKPLVNKVLNPADLGFSKVSSRKRGNKKQDPQDLAKKINNSNSFENLGK